LNKSSTNEYGGDGYNPVLKTMAAVPRFPAQMFTAAVTNTRSQAPMTMMVATRTPAPTAMLEAATTKLSTDVRTPMNTVAVVAMENQALATITVVTTKAQQL
jgi:hypothetical protein